MFNSPEQKEEAKKKRVEQLNTWREKGEWSLSPGENSDRSPKVLVNKDSSLISSLRSGDEEGTIAALEKGANPNDSPFLPSTPLHDSLTDANMNIVKALVEHGAIINIRDIEGWTPLHVAAHWGHLEAVQYLCENGADPTALTDDLEFPHEIADDKSIADYLLDVLKDKGVTNEKMLELKTLEAIQMKEDAKKFISEGRDLNEIVSEDGANMLHIAASKNYVELARFLLDNGIKPNAVESEGWTALHIACFWGYRDMIILLVEKGCDLNLLTYDEESCIDLPESEIIRTLIQDLLEKQEKARKSSTLSVTRAKSITRKSSIQRQQLAKDAIRLEASLQKQTIPSESYENIKTDGPTNLDDDDDDDKPIENRPLEAKVQKNPEKPKEQEKSEEKPKIKNLSKNEIPILWKLLGGIALFGFLVSLAIGIGLLVGSGTCTSPTCRGNEGDLCAASSCSECAEFSGCVWCTSSDQPSFAPSCLPGNSHGDLSSVCSSYMWTQCKVNTPALFGLLAAALAFLLMFLLMGFAFCIYLWVSKTRESSGSGNELQMSS